MVITVLYSAGSHVLFNALRFLHHESQEQIQ